MVGRQILVLIVGVQLLLPQPTKSTGYESFDPFTFIPVSTW